MKNKIVINIMLVYFVLLTIVLVAQLPRQREVINTEPVVDNAMYEEKLEDAVVIYDRSPVMLVNKQQLLINENNSSIVPFIQDDVVYVPLSFFSQAYDATLNFSANKGEVTVRLNNTAMVLYADKLEGTLVDTEKQTPIECTAKIIVKDNTAYVPLEVFAGAFEKNVAQYDKMVVVSASENVFDEDIDKNLLEEVRAQVDDLPVVATENKLKQLIGANENVASKLYKSVVGYKETNGQLETATADSDSQNSADYSQTNVQVEGVDEADVVKNDGEYIYSVAGNKVSIVKASDYKKMTVTGSIEFEGDYEPQEIYLNGNQLIVLGDLNKYSKVYIPPEENLGASTSSEVEIVNNFDGVRCIARIYDITDKSNPTLVREAGADGNYQDSRKVGDKLYFIANKNVYSLCKDDEFLAPCYYDSVMADNSERLSFNDIKYFPEMSGYAYTNIVCINLSDLTAQANIASYLGAGENIYMSENNLYIAQVRYSQTHNILTEVAEVGVNSTTNVYRLALNDKCVKYSAMATVEGNVLNQFSMDENNGYFRIATTTGNESFMYVLDSSMEVCGSIDGIAKGEKMYSARFMGDKAYMVTFKVTDPLFVIDLTTPEKPAVLGALKIPGYSDYLQPYDENHIIGFGKDTVEYEGNAYYLGMKVSMFDVTDLANPKEMFTTVIGDRGTNSELLNDHKALLFDKDKNILAFPVQLYTKAETAEIEGDTEEDSAWSNIIEYGVFRYQGAFIYSIDMEKGFVEQGRITHISDEEYAKMANDYYDYGDEGVRRILYIGDNMYTVSDSKIVACSIGDYKNLYTVEL